MSPRIDDSHSSRLAPAVAGLVALVVYVGTLMPGVSFGDWAEMQTLPHVLGVAHPTGYPTYILLAWFFELVPLGAVAFRANLLSAVLVSGTLVTLALIAQRLGVRPSVAAAAALATGAIGTVWAAATVAEVNPLHLLLAALLIHRALRWADERRPRDLVLGGLLLGLALGNHLLTLFVAPFLFVFVLWTGRRELRERPSPIVWAAAATVAGLAVYIYIPLAAAQSPPLSYNHPTTLDGVIWLATGTQFRGDFDFLTPKSPNAFLSALPALWSLMSARATILVPGLGAIGLLLLLRVRPAFGLAASGILITGVYVWANYRQLEHYLLVPFFVLGIALAVTLEWAARALSWLIRRAARWLRPGSARLAGADLGRLVAGVGLAFAVGLALVNRSANDRSGDHSGQMYVDTVFSSLPQRAAIISYWDASAPLWYGQFVEGLRPDVLIVDDTNLVYEGWGSAEARIATLICQRPVYMIRAEEPDLVTVRQRFDVEKFLDVRISAMGPSAVVTRQVWHVAPKPGTCPTSAG